MADKPKNNVLIWSLIFAAVGAIWPLALSWARPGNFFVANYFFSTTIVSAVFGAIAGAVAAHLANKRNK